MKKFLLTAGALLLVAGLGLSWAGIRMGGETMATVHLFGRSWNVYAPSAAGWNVASLHEGTATASLEAVDRAGSDPVESVLVTDNNATPFSAVSLDVDLGNVTIAAGDDYGVEIRSWGTGYAVDFWYNNSNDTLYIESNDSDSFLPTNCGSEITVYVPADIRLESLYVDLDLGDLTLAGLDLGYADISLDLGSLTGEALSVTTTFQVEASLGEVVLFGDLGEYVDISADLGSVQLGLSRPISEYCWELEADLGSVTVDGQEQKLVDYEVTGGDGNRSIVVDADLGSITLDFDSDFAGEQSTTVTQENVASVTEDAATPRPEGAQGEAVVTEGAGEIPVDVQEGTATE